MIEVTGFKDETVAVMGLARSGLAAAEALKKGGARVLAWDDDAKKRDAATALGLSVADLRSTDLSAVRALVLSPGIPSTFPTPHKVAARMRDAGIAMCVATSKRRDFADRVMDHLSLRHYVRSVYGALPGGGGGWVSCRNI